MFAPFARSHIRLCTDRVSPEDGLRQERTAAEILQRLARQPGVVLADEVGMGKTFVAMAVAASILIDRFGEGPVVVMVPSSLREKWPKDWKVFCEKCLRGQPRHRIHCVEADSGVSFLRHLNKKPQLLFLTHGALQRALTDGYAKLAVLKRAFKWQRSLERQRSNFPRFAGRLLRLEGVENRAPGLLGDLLDRPYESWKRVIHQAHPSFEEKVTEDPVPRPLEDALEAIDSTTLQPLIEELHNLPLREGARIDERLKSARQALAAAMAEVWKLALKQAQFTSPLLILDEAHHLKNPSTHLASLFVNEEAVEDEGETESDAIKAGGALGGKFERLLFLTATPFQLGHAELIRVLERFEGISWDSPQPPVLSRAAFKEEINELSCALNDSQEAALRLDRSWGRLTEDYLVDGHGQPTSVEQWWDMVQAAPVDGTIDNIVARVESTHLAMKRAEGLLRPWVLREQKSKQLPGAPSQPRRRTLTGAAIRGGSDEQGLEIEGDVLLPFLLAGRAQALLANEENGRALFAEGLASSFEAYFETRNLTLGKFDTPDNADDRNLTVAHAESKELGWYLKQLDLAVPRESAAVRRAHPKVRATAECAVNLWRAGEKVLVFCHYRATGRALRRHISDLLHDEVIQLGRKHMPGSTVAEIPAELERLGKRFFDRGGPLRQELDDLVHQLPAFQGLTADEAGQMGEVISRFLRTPSFLARNFDLSATDRVAALRAAFERADASGLSLRQRLNDFCQLLAERCIPTERQAYLDALESIQTGAHVAGPDAFDPGEGIDDSQRALLLPNVRLVNGEVKAETRRTLLLTFNTPLFPEILIASRVLAEGVDLHLNCRYVIHHDLDWNPSLLEQRTGRVDRLGCKAERTHAPIQIYLPYVAATQDEKMYRVVRDRERWFQIVMGEKYETAEAATERRARRIPLPRAVQEKLALHLQTEKTLG
jgi:superfamily II DNA or RNA helicase